MSQTDARDRFYDDEADGQLAVTHHVTRTAAERFLVICGAEAGSVALLGEGEWAQAYGFKRHGVSYVIRFSSLLEDFEKDRIAVSFESPRLPIPRVLEIGSAFNGYFAISQSAAGSALDHLDEAAIRKILPSLFETLRFELRTFQIP